MSIWSFPSAAPSRPTIIGAAPAPELAATGEMMPYGLFKVTVDVRSRPGAKRGASAGARGRFRALDFQRLEPERNLESLRSGRSRSGPWQHHRWMEFEHRDKRWMRHTTEGSDDMPAHIRSALTQTSLSIPVIDGRMALGTWQGVYLFEHRSAPFRRSVVLHLIG